MPEHRDVSFVKIHIMIIIIKYFFLTFRAKKPYIVKWFKAFCTLPFFFCGVHLKTTTSKMQKKIHKLLEIFRENMMISRILFNLFLFLFGPRSVLDFWLSNCCNSCSMEKQFSRLCSSLLALTFLEVNEIYNVVNFIFFVKLENVILFWAKKTRYIYVKSAFS